ncbi:MAG: class I SAM-dependent methyltransferase [Planctomycetes bacterium]|nr:class I SAM-dependent methyltransferase [Planctomycetota bacterium]
MVREPEISREETFKRWDGRYQGNDLPWDSGAASSLLILTIEKLRLRGLRVLEIGCGTGTNAIWLAKNGFEVVACDLSRKAIEMAKEKAQRERAEGISFLACNILDTAPCEDDGVDFVFDRGCFHSIPDVEKHVFVERVANALHEKGLWLTLTGSKDEVREEAEMGPPQMSATELVGYIEPKFQIHELHTTNFTSRMGGHLAWHCLSRKR